MHNERVSTSAARGHRAWQAGEIFTVNDATELYEVDRWGKGYFSISTDGHVLVHPTKDPAQRHRSQAADRSPDAARASGCRSSFGFETSFGTASATSTTRFPAAINQHQYEGRYVCVYPIKVNQQRQVVEEVLDFGTGVRLRPRGGLEAGAAGGDGPGLQRHAHHLQRLQGRRVHRDGDAGPEDRAQRHPGRREIHGARPDPEVRREGRRRPADRHARQARRPRRRPLAGLGRLPLEVRPDGRRDPARARGAEAARHAGLLQAPALPPRQPDPEHPHRQGGAQRGGPDLHGAGQGRRRPRVSRRRRRAGRRLRRLADELRVERQLHARGIRQRRRLPHPDGVRRRRREASDDRVGERPGDRRVPQRADLQRARRLRLRRGEDSGVDLARRSGAARHRPAGDVPEPVGRGTRSRATTTRSRRSTWR